MITIVKETKEIVDVRRNDEGIYIQNTEPKQWRYPHELKILGYTSKEVEEIKKCVKEQYKSEIDWEKRRYEIAKAAMQGMMANIPDDSFCHVQAKECIEIADELIKELKGE